MRVFVLCTGRCGSTTFAVACSHIDNFTSGHETRAKLLGSDRLDYPDRHIEVDNRLSWFLGGLQQRFGDDPLYVHLRHDPEAVVSSFVKRFDRGIIATFNGGIVMKRRRESEAAAVCRHYVDTVTANIEAFLADKPRQMTIWLGEAAELFPDFWERIGAAGDLDAALHEFTVRHNASDEGATRPPASAF